MATVEREFLQLESTQGGWGATFQHLHQISRHNAGSQLQAKKPMNIVRNRYRDVLPIDTTRVKLLDDDNDYINANFVKVEEVNRLYILSQGPLQHTLIHFWQMIWEQKTVGIVMLNKCVERGMNKCSPYWPAMGESPMLLGDRYLVESVSSDEEESYRLTHLRLHNLETEDSRTIFHFHYLRWPDFGVPQTPNVFLDFLLAVRSSGILDREVGPAVVHCSAGIGRSGTFCLVDVCLAKLEETKNLGSINAQQLLLDMRRQRLGLIQTPDQLRFSYIAILQGAYGHLGLKNGLYELSKEMEESSEDELVSSEESEEESAEAQHQRKYPHLNRSHGVSYDTDIPPPIPPRPPDTLPPPPPPTSLPPGPPETHYETPQETDPTKTEAERQQDRDKDREMERLAATAYENGDIEIVSSESEKDIEEEEPPPIPPRSNSLSPETKTEAGGGGGGGGGDFIQQGIKNGKMADHFLGGGGRGGESISHAPLPQTVSGSGVAGAVCSASANRSDENEEIPPPIPEKIRGKKMAPAKPSRELQEEETRLLTELNHALTESEKEEGERVQPQAEPLSSAELRRRREREERKDRVSSKVRSIRERLTEQEERGGEGGGVVTSDLSLPWLLFGFAVVIGYTVYYFLS